MAVSSGGGVRRWAREFGAINPVPKGVVSSLDSVLASMFVETQLLTHVITGELKASGHTRTDWDGTTWTGEIVYGPPTNGDHGPAYYAVYEMARGGAHDWYRTMPAWDPFLEAAVLTAWKP